MRRKTVLLGMMAAAALYLSACNGESAAPAGDVAPVTEAVSGIADKAITEEADKTAGGEAPGSQAVEKPDQEKAGTGAYPDGSVPQYSGTKLKLTVDGEEIIIAMYDNTAVDAFLERLPLEDIHFSDLMGLEKPAETPEEPFSIGDEEPGYDLVPGEMVIYRPWGNFTIFYGDFRHSDELVPLGKVESGLEILSGKTDDFVGTLELAE